ncbi:hypothetical protein HanPSC8_Chr15g0655061 [Helianthus annuus]|nr:hypothetical protein HanPSC8_Chr15g0655061 [Helianthus annuus]
MVIKSARLHNLVNLDCFEQSLPDPIPTGTLCEFKSRKILKQEGSEK